MDAQGRHDVPRASRRPAEGPVGRAPVAVPDAAYRALFESGAAGMMLARARDGVVLRCNREARELLGMGEGQVRDKGLCELFDASDPRFGAAIEERRSTGNFRGRLRMLRDDGSSFAVEASLAGYREDGESRVAVVFREPTGREEVLQSAISELEEGRKRLAASEGLFRATFDQAAVGMAHVSADGRWLRVNDALCGILGRRREELLQLTFQEITHPGDVGKDLEHVEKMLAGEIDAYRMEKRYLGKGRSVVWADLRVSLIRRASGEPECFVAAVEDITEAKLEQLVPDPPTERELRVLGLVAAWKTDQQIASELGYSVATIKRDVGFVLSKLRVKGRRQAASRATDIGLIGPAR